MPLPFTAYNARYTFVAMLCGAIVTVLAVIGSVVLLLSERMFADFETEMPSSFMFYSRLGTAGIAAVWLLTLTVIGAMFLIERQKTATVVALAASSGAGMYFGWMLVSTLAIWWRVMWVVW